LSSGDRFGTGIAAIGDMDSDGSVDIVVGASGSGRRGLGAIYILFLGPSANVLYSKSFTSEDLGEFVAISLTPYDLFGSSVTSLGDLGSDGGIDLAVGASNYFSSTNGEIGNAGAVVLLSLTFSTTRGRTVGIETGLLISTAQLQSFGYDNPEDTHFGFSLTSMDSISSVRRRLEKVESGRRRWRDIDFLLLFPLSMLLSLSFLLASFFIRFSFSLILLVYVLAFILICVS
jgi:hypothetical protein